MIINLEGDLHISYINLKLHADKHIVAIFTATQLLLLQRLLLFLVAAAAIVVVFGVGGGGGGVGPVAVPVAVLDAAVVVMMVAVVVAVAVDGTDSKVAVPRMIHWLRHHSFLHLLNTIQHFISKYL